VKAKSFLKNGLVGLSLTFLASSFLTSMPALAETEIRAVMHSDLRLTDPVFTTAHMTRNHGYMIYDVLIAKDSNFNIRPQMADWTVSDDGKIYTFTLRDGLKFHDGAPVTAQDAVASLKRWGTRDSGGKMLMAVTQTLEPRDEKTFVWTLTEPFGPLLDIVSKYSSIPAFIMPERVANTPSDQPIDDFTGSGPFKIVVEEFQPGVGVTYVKNEDYVPRDEPADGLAGGKVVYVDKVRWITMPDQQTAVNALVGGEIDYLEQIPTDLLPLIEDEEDVVIEVIEDFGYHAVGRMNFKHPPFDNPKIRQAARLAIYQEPILLNIMSDPKYYNVCGAVLGCGMPFGSETGSETLINKGDPERAKALLAEAGYDGTPLVIMQPTDVAVNVAPPIVASQQLRAVGFNVDLQPMDWQTLVTRRTSKAPPSEGGWNMFFNAWQIPEIASPLSSPMLGGLGDESWFGWPEDPKIEELKRQFIAAKDDEGRKAVAEEIQQHVMDFVHYVPIGEFHFLLAHRRNIVDMLPISPVFWNIKKQE